ncbi:hypothetical protein HMI54_000714 [Coelomomyces lativittatus]|nr:hypothetical protein HMI55_000217 [Coelomomyces lativittatus]KAJ1511585.1 hypothetical protein HMI54_000714 [Coelomomyces lativittatus]KAJ1514204.1 hypothetical protein HMI56_000936 [Coelomomyces lativittatus]
MLTDFINAFIRLLRWIAFCVLSLFFYWSAVVFVIHFPSSASSSFFFNLLALYSLLVYLSLQLITKPKPVHPPILHPPLPKSLTSSPLLLSSSLPPLPPTPPSPTPSIDFLSQPSIRRKKKESFSSNLKASTINGGGLPEQLIIQKLENLTIQDPHHFFFTPSTVKSLHVLKNHLSFSLFHSKEDTNRAFFFWYHCLSVLSLVYCFRMVFKDPESLSFTSINVFQKWCPFKFCT